MARSIGAHTSSRYSRAGSPPMSTTGSASIHQQPRTNIVSRVAIEGKTRAGTPGAKIKIYLRVR